MNISVIIPTLDEQSILADCLRSAFEAGADQVVVADGGSADGTTDLARQLGCEVVTSRPGRGFQLAAGANVATGDVLVFLHADCSLNSDCLNQLRQKLPAQRWGCYRHKIDADGRRFRWLERGNHWRSRKNGLVYGDQGLWVERDLYDSVGGFPHVPLMEDVAISDALKAIEMPTVLAGPISLSPRHWKKRGVILTTLRNKILFRLFRLGFSPDRVAAMYRR